MRVADNSSLCEGLELLENNNSYYIVVACQANNATLLQSYRFNQNNADKPTTLTRLNKVSLRLTCQRTILYPFQNLCLQGKCYRSSMLVLCPDSIDS